MPLNLENIDLGSFGGGDGLESTIQDEQLSASISEAVKINPDQRAQTTELSKQSGVPEFAVEDNPTAVEDQLKLDNIDLSTMSKRTPNTAKYLTDFNNASIAHDDIDVMQEIEDIFDFGKTFENLGESISSSFTSQGAGLLAAGVDMTPTRIQDLVPSSGMPIGMEGDAAFISMELASNLGIDTDEQLQQAKVEATDQMLVTLKEQQAKRKDLTPEDLNLLEQGVRAGVESLANMAPGFGLMLLSGGRAAPLLATIGVQTFGDSYAQARADDLTPQQSAWFASINAAIEVGTEVLPTGTLEQILTGQKKGLTKAALKFLVQEMGTEQLATLGQTLNENAFGIDEEMKAAETVEEMVTLQLRRQAITAIATVVAGGAQAIAVTGVRKTVEAIASDGSQKETQGDVEQRKLDQLNTAAGKSKLKARSKESFKQFVEQADGDNNTNVFIDGAQTSLYLQTKTRDEIAADPALTLLQDGVNEAAALGGEISMPVADFTTEIAGTEHFEQLRDSMTMSEDTVAPFRQEQVQAETQAYIKTLLDDANDNVSEYVEAQEIYTMVRDQLVDTGQMSAQNASIAAQVVPAWATAQARSSGKTVQQVYQDAGLVIEGPQTGERARLEGEQVLSQEPAFREAPNLFVQARDKFLEDLDENAESEDVLDVAEGFGPEYRNFIKALERDDWLGFDFPSQAIDAALSEEFENFDPSPGLKSAMGRMVNAEAATGTVFAQSPVEEQTETAAFKEWSGNGEVVDPEDINDHDFKADTPTVVKVFHGTTHEFSVFDALRGNLEGQFGAVNYFTSSEQDASDNYAGEGPDLTQRIQQRAEQLEEELGEFDADDVVELAEQHGLEFDAETESFPEDLPTAMATQELSGGQDQTMELFVRVDNPFVIGDQSVIELIDNDSAHQQAIENVAEANDITVEEVEENIDDFEDEVDEARYEIEAETPNKLTEAIQTVAENEGVEASEIAAEVYNLGAEATAEDIEELMRTSEDYAFNEDPETGGFVGTHRVAQVIEEMGFDSIILKNAGDRFSSMEMEQGTAHVHIFDSGKTNIKSVDNQGTFDPTDPDIFKQPTSDDAPGARGYYDPANDIIRLTEASDLSTFLHEFAHFMYEMEVKGDTEMLQSINNWYKRNADDVAAEANSYLTAKGFDAEKQLVEQAPVESDLQDVADDNKENWELFEGTVQQGSDPDGFLYHITTESNAAQIMSDGLIPDSGSTFESGIYKAHSRGRVFVTELNGVEFWKEKVENSLFDQFDDPDDIAVVRIPKDKVGDLQKDDVGSTDARADAYFSETILYQTVNTPPPTGKAGSITPEDVTTYLESNTTGDKDKDSAIRRAVHEQFARGFETYLMEGKAPSIELRNAFRTFARWLSQIYARMRGDLNVNLDKEMRQVFDRLLATEEQIAAAEARQRVEPMFTDAVMAGMTEEEFSDYQKRISKVKDVQSETLRDKLIKQLTRQQQKWWNEEKRDIADEEIERLKTERVHVAREQLRSTHSDADLRSQLKDINKEIVKFEKELSKLEKENDTVGQFIARNGGLNRESMGAEGVDPEHFKDKSPVFGKPLFPKSGGMTADDLAEKLSQEMSEDIDAGQALEIVFDTLADDTAHIDPEVDVEINSVSNDIQNAESEKSDIEQQIGSLNIKLDFATVKEMVGEEKVNKIGRKSVIVSPKLRGMTAKEHQGLHPDEAAAILGYDSGSELLDDLINAPSIKESADIAAESRMVDRHGDIMTDGTIEKAADEAVQDEERGKLLLSELKTLARGTNAPTVDRATIKAIAAERIGRLSSRQIFPGKYRSAEIKAANEAGRMLAEGNKEGAAAAKMRQVLNYYLGMEATNAKNETVKIVDRMARYSKKKVQIEIMKSEGGHWEQIVKILDRFEFRKSATLGQVDAVNENINTWAADRIENAGDGLVLTPAVLNELFVTHWKNVPFSDLQGINDSVKNIEHVARYSNKMNAIADELEFKKLKGDWVDSINTNDARFDTKASKSRTADSRKATTSEHVRRWASQLTKVPFLASWLDGGERVGLSHQILIQPLTDALDAKMNLVDSTATPVNDAIIDRSKADQKRHMRKIWIPEINDHLLGHQVLAVALNTGNAGNLRKLLLGEGWADPEVDTDISIDNPQLQAVLKHMTKSDWELVQTIWDQMETLYPQLAEVHRKTTGLAPPKVESTPVVTEFGTFKGGYYPVKYSPERSHKAEKNAEKRDAETESMFNNTASIQASVNTGATNERTGFYDRIYLSLEVVPDHFNETIHYITHHDAVRQINKLIQAPDVANAISGVLGESEFKQLKPWLNDVAKDGRQQPTKTFIDEAFQRLRFGTTLGVMGFKASTGIMQFFGLFTTAAELGVGPTVKGIQTAIGRNFWFKATRQVLGSADDMQTGWEFATERSKVLNHRAETMDREIRNAMTRLQGKRGIIAATQEVSMKHIALIQTYMVDLPTWLGAYEKKVSETGDEKLAAQFADLMVESLQGSGSTKDMAAIVRNQSKVITTFTMFMTFFSSLGNLSRDLVKGQRSGRYSPTSVAAKLMFLYTIPVFMEMLMRGDLDEPEGEDDRLSKYATAVALYPMASVPFARDVAGGLIGDFGYNASPVSAMLERGIAGFKGIAVAAVTDKEVTKGQLKGASKLVGAALGIPGVNQIWSTGEHLYDVIEEGEDATIREGLFGPKRD